MPDIVSYLRYLHDVNRKLLQRGGLDNVLYRKPASQNPYYHQLDQPDPSRPRHWLASLRHIQTAQIKGLALRPLIGFGLTIGQMDTLKGKKRIAAPLALCSATLVEDEQRTNSVQMQPAWDSLTLNYDFLTLFLGQEQELEQEDEAALPQNGVGGPTLAVFNEVENELEAIAQNSNPDSCFNRARVAKLMKYVHDSIPEFRSISIADDNFDHRQIETIIQSKPPVFYAHKFFFVSQAAGELTTMTALSALIKQTERSSSRAFR